jgi:hypothetical protein
MHRDCIVVAAGVDIWCVKTALAPKEEGMKSQLVTAVLTLAIVGCSSLTAVRPITKETGKPVPPARVYRPELTVPSPGHTATVSFLRDAGFPGSGCTHKILVDGDAAFAIYAGEYQTLYLEPGKHAFTLLIERGPCPEYSTTYTAALRDGAEESYRIFIPSIVDPPRLARVGAPGAPSLASTGTRTALVLVGMADGKVPRSSVKPPFEWEREHSTAGTSLTLRETNRFPGSNGTYVEYELKALGFSPREPATLWWRLGTTYTQLPALMGDDGIVSIHGTRNIGTEGNVPGGALDLALTSGDNRAYANAIPFPIDARAGACWASVEVMTESGRVFLITFGGFKSGEKVQIMSRSGDQRIDRTVDASSDGKVRFPVLFELGGNGTATARAIGDSGAVSIEYSIGRGALTPQ